MTTEQHFAYLAGIIDGEGTITIQKYRQHNRPTFQYKPRLIVSNTDLRLLDWLQKEFGGSVITHHKGRPNCNIHYLWRVIAMDKIEEILSGCLPYLIIKRQQADLVLRYIGERNTKKRGRNNYGTYGEVEEQIFVTVRDMNARGIKKDAV